MSEFSFLTDSSSIQLDFVERESTLRELMRVSIQLHPTILSTLDIISTLERFGVEREK